MDFQCSFAGVPFRLPTPDVLSHIQQYGFLDQPRDVLPLGQVWPGANLHKLGSGTPFDYPAPKLGEYFYPQGASRYSIFRGLMTAADLAAVYDSDSYASPTDPVGPGGTAPFALVNPVDASSGLTTRLCLLPPITISQAAGEPTLYLITLVDERYFWHQFKTLLLQVTASSTWTAVLNAIAGAAGVTLTFSTPSSVYGVPDPDSALYSTYESTAALFDAAANDVGCAVVRNLDGTYKLQSYADAAAAVQANRPASGNNVLGGGGKPLLPYAVNVSFPVWTTASGYYEPYNVRDHVMDSYGEVAGGYVNTLPSQFDGLPFIEDLEKTLHCSGKAIWASLTDIALGNLPSNNTALSALAAQLATDYWTRLSARLDETYAGIYPWTPEGISDVLYHWGADICFTRVMPPPYNAGLTEFQNATTAPTTPLQTGTDPSGYVFYQGRLVAFGS
jgi:hypothetical protein